MCEDNLDRRVVALKPNSLYMPGRKRLLLPKRFIHSETERIPYKGKEHPLTKSHSETSHAWAMHPPPPPIKGRHQWIGDTKITKEGFFQKKRDFCSNP